MEGRENLRGLPAPVIFASNHQSLLDVPAILCALPEPWRTLAAPAMAKEFFDAHFHPERHRRSERFTSGLNYVLAALFFNAFPLPQREAGTREALRYAGELASDGYCIVIFPEGVRTEAERFTAFSQALGCSQRGSVSRWCPVKFEGLEKVLHKSARMATPGRVVVKFGRPLHTSAGGTYEGSDYQSLARRIEEAVRSL